jgi:large subunit ribosomal protein L3
MGKRNKPRAGSMAFYPRVRAKNIVAKFRFFGDQQDLKEVKPLCFFGVKAGMITVFAKNAKNKSSSYGQKIAIPATVVEVPELKVVGARFYKEDTSIHKKSAVFDFIVYDKVVKKRILGNKQKKTLTIEDALKRKEEADSLRLIVSINLKQTGLGQKKPYLAEVPLSGTYDQQIEYLKSKLNNVINAEEVCAKDDFLDVKGITIGHGYTGPVKRFGIKIQRPKSQQIQRHVGSIGPWHPATVMYTVPRAGQHGFHTRTTFNKRLLMIDKDVSKVVPKSGFKNYGVIKNNYVVIAGNLPGPVKRIVTIRKATRPQRTNLEVSEVEEILK